MTFNFSLASDQQVHDELCHRLRQARLNAELTQKELAERSGVALNTIGRLELGKISPTLASIIAILRALGLIEQLDSFLPPPPPSPLRQVQGGSPKQRVRKSKKLRKPSAGWKWDDEK
ncbi:helix-turn-helix domain-containing protein [Gilvimarinus sp. F26214L]|uniref:helix-turn-helix domain-containing protein n=1 Tax=Gilvimarinus sp. DZF01 TaxID=3461371 RepID=UPI0040453AFF